MQKTLTVLLLLLLALAVRVTGQNVTFSTTRGFYDAPFQLTLSTSLAGGSIRYTTDGSAPSSTAGTVYAGPIAIATTSVVRAIGYSGTASTPVATHSYFFLNDVVRQPATIAGWPNHDYAVDASGATATHDYEMDPDVVNAPAYSAVVKTGLLSIPTMSLVLNKNDFWDLYEGESTHPTSVEMLYPDGTREQFNCDLEAHSHNRLKRSLKLAFSTSVTTNLLRKTPYNSTAAATANTFKDTKIVLRAGNNRSWARNWNPDRTCYTRDEWYRVSQQIISGEGGRGTFVHLYVNGLYWGLYNPVERTDAGMLAQYYGGSTGDWMALDHDGIRSGDPTRFTFLTTNLVNQDMSVAANYAQLKSYLDVSKFCDYLILTWMTGMTDWPGNNFHGANRNVPPGPYWYNAWDCEWSWDVTNNSNLGAWVHPEFRNNTTGSSTIASLWHAARRSPEFMQLFADRVYRHCFNNGGLTDAASRARWAQINDFIKTAIVDESARWGDALNDGVTRTRDGHWTPEINRVDGLMNGNVTRFINALVAQGYYPTLAAPGFSQEGGTVASGAQLTLSNPNGAGTIYYTTDGTDPRAAGGAAAAGATTYGGPFALTGSVTVKARVLSGGTWSPLHEASFTVSGLISGLFINEFMASNTKLADEFGEFDDWIEIYNAGTQPVNVGGLYVTDLLSNLTKWQIPTTNPALTTIPAKGYLVLWADGQPAQGPLHLNLSLSKGGEAIGLSQLIGSTPNPLDSYTFPAQTDDVSTGRFPDGSATFRTFVAATPGSANVLNFKSGLFINELLAVNQNSITDEAGEHDPWIEIYNNNAEAVNIGGLYVTNSLGSYAQFRIPTTNAAQTTIPAKGFLRLWADNEPAEGILHLGLALNAGGGQLGLADVQGPDVSVIDSTRYGAQVADVSRGRYPDASKQFKAFASPTPGATNTVPAVAGLFINEFLASNTKYPDEFGEFDDWIEIYNSGTQPVDIGGFYITDALSNPAKYQIPTTNPAQTTIPAKGFLLLWADDQAFQGVRHVGIKLSAGGEAIGLYQPNGTAVTTLDTYTFGAQTEDVSVGRQTDGAASFVSFTQPTPNASNNGTPPNPAPTANAGPDQTLTLPVSSAALAGSGTDDGTITGYTWSLVSGPSTPVFSPDNLVAGPTISGLVAGTYTLALVVKDNLNALSAPDQVVITVNPAVSGPAVSSFTLVNADTDTDIQPLTAGETLNLATLPTRNLNVRANTSPATVGSVVFALTGAQTQNQTESVAPYALFSDAGGDYAPWTPPVGNYSLTARPYSAASGGGTAGTALTISFSVTDATAPGPFTLTTSTVGSGTVTKNPNAASYAAGTVVTLTATPAAGQQFAGWSGDASGTTNPLSVTMSANKSITATFTAIPAGQSVASFTLVNADTDTDIQPLTAGATLNLATLPTRNLNVRANTSPATVGSVVFALSGAQTQNQTESVAPYALFSDAGGDYNPWTPAVGSYSLTARPYSAASGGGTAGTALTISFSVTDATAPGPFTLTTAVVGSGSVTKNPNAASYASGTIVSLTATPATGYTFSGWSGDATGTTNPLSVTMSANKSITATFTAIPAGQSVASFTLVNADTDQDIQTLTAGAVLNLAALPTRNLNVRANTSPATVGSVVFALTGAQTQNQTESVAPYALFSDAGGDYNPWTPAVGSYSLTARPYSAASGGGTAGTPLTISFSVTDASAPGPFTLTTSTVGSGTVTKNPNAASYASGTVVSLTATPAAGYTFSGWSGDASGTANPLSVTMSANKTITATFTAVPAGQAVASFTLVNADTDQDIQTLTTGATLNLATLPTRNLNVRANTSPATVGSVVFALSGTQTRSQTESVAPYALFGDNGAGDYTAWTPAVGSYSLTGTPYSGAGGGGTAGAALTVGFSVINQVTGAKAAPTATAAPVRLAASTLQVYPNPTATGRFTVLLPDLLQRELSYTLTTEAGTLLARGKCAPAGPATRLTFDFSAQMPTAGVYYLHLANKQATVVLKLERP
ncbi:InlB B-repeat-containing protein [Hymenobacter aquaticus]|nr:lamin tail domain-containing protein [Hymenobacter aquaticus]